MKFVHIADMHFDIPFTTLNKKELGNQRRLEQRKIFKEIIEYIKQNKVDYLFIAGDLYEHEYVKQSTVEYINNLFCEIPNVKIYITPGNHDPLIKNSYYETYNWNENVHIFKSKIEKIENENICIYGYGFDNFYKKDNELKNIEKIDENKINILITHANLDGLKNSEEEYNPISKKELIELKFNYIALGHIHKKTSYMQENTSIIYPGSPMSLGFDEKGEHGMIVGQINEENKKIDIEFIKLDKKEFVEINLDVSSINNEEELIEKINELNLEENKYYKIIFTGNRKFEINIYNIEKNIYNQNIIKIKNNTKIEMDFEKLKNENTLKGIFIKNMLEKIEKNPEKKDEILKVLEIGLNAM